jgi:molybdate transport system substrate-binding protein
MAPPDGDSRLVRTLLLSTVLVTGCKSQPGPPASQATIQVAAASDLTLAFEELGKLFEQRTGHRVTFSFAASGTLAKQLGQGAPFDVFAAANASFVDSAVQSGACDGATRARYARGHLVAWSRSGGIKLATLADLRAAELEHIAIANPEHAPYGRAAREALLEAGLWAELEGKIVQAENVRQALQFAESGNADVAIVARSLLTRSGGNQLSIDPALHAPIEQTLVVCRRGKNMAGGHAFAALVESPDGQALLQRYGFGGSAEQAGK